MGDKAYNAAYQKTEAGKRAHRRAYLKQKYGISLEGYEHILQKQRGVCAICGHINPSGRALHVDHCHTTGTVRGLLCVNCNKGIGHFKDDVSRLEAAIDYLKERN